MKIVITGTEGFIGKHLFNQLKDGNNILEINEDIFNSDDWLEDLYHKLKSFNPEVVFHVGACSDTMEYNVNYMMLVNYLFTQKLSEWCKNNNCKLIYSSSAASYGVNGRQPSNLYGWSKFTAEQYVIKNDAIALRYFNVYGPEENHKGKMASIATQMMEKFKKGESIELFPQKPKRDFVYVKDVIDANIFAFNNFEKLKSKWYEVGSGDARTFEDVLDILKIPFTYTNENQIPKGYQFFTKSNKENWMNGWSPKYNLEKGLYDYLQLVSS